MDTAIANATEAVLLSHGYSAVNIDRVAKMAGTTRAAIYRRAKTPGELVVALLVSRFGLDPASDSGNLREDLRAIQELQRIFFTDPMVQAGLAGVLSDLRNDDQLGEAFYARFMEPRRHSVAAMLSRAADRGEIAPLAHPGVVSDLLTGPLLLRAALPPLGPVDDILIDATIEAALAACGAPDR
ncbi:TetR family transcriptional regulator [Mycobacterium sp. CBMA 234]|uniref:TetR/AcrR family transcriptional regulator n=1 Tax=Mycolicibacterium sp. CBMA 234 TaxID=1918495 RepID=UPI0012DFE3A7|nr:TetR/AcrR family transcriptional regulator [Mycolicibacterium sp. CBMA 234]MUL62957.1 TetR family transcriptional regulator [Mycolicibacterium sp. CBMA 234]